MTLVIFLLYVKYLKYNQILILKIKKKRTGLHNVNTLGKGCQIQEIEDCQHPTEPSAHSSFAVHHLMTFKVFTLGFASQFQPGAIRSE